LSTIWELRADHSSPDYAIAADEFIRNFKWDDADTSHFGLEPYFNLTIVQLDT